MNEKVKQFLLARLDKLPLCGHYQNVLSIATLRINPNVEQCRRLYGLYTYAQHNINIDEL